jgi:hypothetical protein
LVRVNAVSRLSTVTYQVDGFISEQLYCTKRRENTELNINMTLLLNMDKGLKPFNSNLPKVLTSSAGQNDRKDCSSLNNIAHDKDTV